MANNKEQPNDNTNTNTNININMFMSPKNLLPRRRGINCCGIIVALVLLQVVLLGVLALTVFRFRDPNLKLDSLNVQSLSLLNTSTNLSLKGEVLVKNQNWGEFKYDQAGVVLSHVGGVTVGEVLAGKIPSGRVKMRRSKRVGIVLEAKIDYGNNDIIILKCHAEMSGKVNMLGLLKKRRVGVLDCKISVDLERKTIREFDCL